MDALSFFEKPLVDKNIIFQRLSLHLAFLIISVTNEALRLERRSAVTQAPVDFVIPVPACLRCSCDGVLMQ